MLNFSLDVLLLIFHRFFFHFAFFIKKNLRVSLQREQERRGHTHQMCRQQGNVCTKTVHWKIRGSSADSLSEGTYHWYAPKLSIGKSVDYPRIISVKVPTIGMHQNCSLENPRIIRGFSQ